jgi:hypothetical protein
MNLILFCAFHPEGHQGPDPATLSRAIQNLDGTKSFRYDNSRSISQTQIVDCELTRGGRQLEIGILPNGGIAIDGDTDLVLSVALELQRIYGAEI